MNRIRHGRPPSAVGSPFPLNFAPSRISMSWINAFQSRIRELAGRETAVEAPVDDGSIAEPELESSTGVLGQILIFLLVLPLQLILLPLRALNLFHSRGVDVDYEQWDQLSTRERAWTVAKRIGRGLLAIPYFIATAPIHFIRGLARSSPRELLFIVPALLMIGFFGFVIFQNWGRGNVVLNRYAQGVQKAIQNKDYLLAKTYFERLLEEEELTEGQRLQYAIVLAEAGEVENARQVLGELAPDDGVGYGPAHRLRSIQLAAELSNSSDPLILGKLGHHLEHAVGEGPQLLEAHAVYHQKLDQPDKALQYLREAAQVNPGYYLMMADYQASLNRSADRENSLRLAREAFEKLLTENPLQNGIRVSLATVLNQLDETDEAEAVLLAGLGKQPDDFLRAAIASFFVMRHDIAKRQQEGISRQMDYLIKALAIDRNHSPIYERLMAMYLEEAQQSPEQRLAIKQELLKLIGGNQPNPMAHFTLSNILWQDGEREQAEFHLEQARKLAPNFVVVLNNLSWMLAHKDPPDLERALDLVTEALKADPQDARFLDTRGTIYLKMGRYRDAVADFQLALTGVSNKQAVHAKLSRAYQELGMDDLSEIHLQHSQEPDASRTPAPRRP